MADRPSWTLVLAPFLSWVLVLVLVLAVGEAAGCCCCYYLSVSRRRLLPVDCLRTARHVAECGRLCLRHPHMPRPFLYCRQLPTHRLQLREKTCCCSFVALQHPGQPLPPFSQRSMQSILSPCLLSLPSKRSISCLAHVQAQQDRCYGRPASTRTCTCQVNPACPNKIKKNTKKSAATKKRVSESRLHHSRPCIAAGHPCATVV